MYIYIYIYVYIYICIYIYMPRSRSKYRTIITCFFIAELSLLRESRFRTRFRSSHIDLRSGFICSRACDHVIDTEIHLLSREYLFTNRR